MTIGGGPLMLAGTGYVVFSGTNTTERTTTSSVAGVTEVVIEVDAGSVDVIGGTDLTVGIRTTTGTTWSDPPIADYQC